jgi:hypothetical protein
MVAKRSAARSARWLWGTAGKQGTCGGDSEQAADSNGAHNEFDVDIWTRFSGFPSSFFGLGKTYINNQKKHSFETWSKLMQVYGNFFWEFVHNETTMMVPILPCVMRRVNSYK